MFDRIGKTHWVGFSLMLGLAFSPLQKAWASNFSINPVQVKISPGVTSSLVTLRNESPQSLRFQISAVSWAQNDRGEMQLTPTQDVIFFPSLLTLAPGEERKVRVSTKTVPGTTEKTYRLFFQELPALQTSGNQTAATQIAMLTRVGIPVFLQPAQVVVQASLSGLATKTGRFSFQVNNTGNSHFSARVVQVTGYNAAQQPIFKQELPGWYVLAGGTRIYEGELPKADCAKIQNLKAEVQTDNQSLQATIALPKGACGP